MATPTISEVTQIYQGVPVTCARIICTEPCSFKFQGVVNAPDDYLFQMVVKANAARTLTITCGGSVDTLAITSSFDRYVIAFPDVAVNENDSLYIDFPAGTYYLYNLQLERGTNATKWQPAPEDAAAYSDKAAAAAVDAQTQRDIFNRLTNNGQTQGIYLYDGKLYLNATYMKSGYIDAEVVEVRNLIADHLRSYSESGLSMLDSQASYLDIRRLVNNIWKQRIGVYVSDSDGGAIRVSSGDVDENGSPISGDSSRTYVFPNLLQVGLDKNGVAQGTITAGYINAKTIGTALATTAISAVNAAWTFSINGVRMFCIVGRSSGTTNKSLIIPTATILTNADTLWGFSDSAGTLQFAIRRSGSTCTVTLKSVPAGGMLISAYAVI